MKSFKSESQYSIVARESYFNIINKGMSFAFSAKGDFKKALEHAEKALTLANEQQKTAINANIAKLKEGKDIN